MFNEVGQGSPFNPSYTDGKETRHLAIQVAKNTVQRDVKEITYTIPPSKFTLVSLLILSTMASYRAGMFMGGAQVYGEMKRVERNVNENIDYFALGSVICLVTIVAFQAGLLYFALKPQHG